MTTAHPGNDEPERTPSYRSVGLLVCGVCLFLILPFGWNRYSKNQEQAIWKRRAELNSKCRQLSREGKWADLEKLAREWKQWDSESEEGLLFLADARLKQGDAVTAQELLLQISDSSDKVLPSLLLASDLQLGAANRPLAAPETLQRVLKINPSLITAQQKLIFFYALTFQRTKMLQQLRKAVATRSEPIEAYVYLIISSHMNLTNGIQFTSRWLQSAPESELLKVARAVHYANTLDSAADADEEPEAEKLARQKAMVALLNEYPENLALLRYFLRRKVRDFDVEAVGRILEQLPDSADGSLFWRYRGWYYAQKRELKKAEAAYRDALKRDRLDWHTWHELAGVLRRTGQLDEAEKLQRTSVVGKELRKKLRQMPDVASVTPQLLVEIRDYAALCGDTLVANALSRRIEESGSQLPQGASPAQ